MSKKVYVDAGTIEQFSKVVEQYKREDGGKDIEYVFLTAGIQVKEHSAEIWRCRKLDRQLQEYNVNYFDM